jgi:hypothetical protein
MNAYPWFSAIHSGTGPFNTKSANEFSEMYGNNNFESPDLFKLGGRDLYPENDVGI